MAAETVMLSRTVTFDRETQPEVARDLKRLEQAGFVIYRAVGDITTAAEAVTRVPEKSIAGAATEAEQRGQKAVSKIEAICSRHGLTVSAVGHLIGVSQPTIHSIARRRRCSQAMLERLETLLHRSNRLPVGSTTLRDEARGMTRLRRMQRKNRRGPSEGAA